MVKIAEESFIRGSGMETGQAGNAPTGSTRCTMNVVMVGGTGFVGRNIAPVLAAGGHAVTILTRNQRAASAVVGGGVHVQEWDPSNRQTLEQPFYGKDAVINLAGASIAERRWTPSRKDVLRASRIETTRTIVTALSRLSTPVRPKIFISSSGVGFYGLEAANGVDEMQGPGNGFLADLCVEWGTRSLPSNGLWHSDRVSENQYGVGARRRRPAKNASPLQILSWGAHRQGHSARELDPRRGSGTACRRHS